MPDIAPLELADPLEALRERADVVSGYLDLLSNPKRLMILCVLAKGEASVGAMQANLGIGQSSLSQHLARLRVAGVVSTRRDAQTIYYTISDPQMRNLMARLYDTFCDPAA